jgi:hypothetical protein
MTVLDEICARIIRMYEGGMKGTNIIGIVGEPTRIVQTKEGGTYKGNPSTERPKKLSESDLRRIQLFSRTHHQSLLQDITNDCPIEVSTRTIFCALHNHDIFNKIAVKKLFLTPLHMSRKLDFARQYCGWSAKDWKCVCWTNKSTFKVGKNSKQAHIWRIASEQYLSSHVVPTFKSGRTSLMIWGGFAGHKKLELVFMPKDRHKAIKVCRISL